MRTAVYTDARARPGATRGGQVARLTDAAGVQSERRRRRQGKADGWCVCAGGRPGSRGRRRPLHAADSPAATLATGVAADAAVAAAAAEVAEITVNHPSRLLGSAVSAANQQRRARNLGRPLGH